ncbi:MAG TPA: hypothetical protein VNG51_16730 [Ktedonobacteraceae bacterium]|nr:hypothetical protein [Ktedonobacteraceae bacterium]
MGLPDWFSNFCSNIQIRDANTISYRYKRITRQLNADFWNTISDTSHSLYVGSYGRNTAIKGFSDLDMVFELPPQLYKKYNSYLGNGQSALLQTVRLSIHKTYSATDIGADGQVIVVKFDGGMTFEINPVFINTAGSYTFPDTNNGGVWKMTNPRPEIQAIKNRNISCNKNLVPLCRMMRAWRRKWDVPIGGLLIDTLVYQFMENYAYRNQSYAYYDWICRDFFAWIAGQNTKQEYWKAPGSHQHVYKKGLFQYKAKRCYNISVDAIAYEKAPTKRERSAKQKWREIFGNDFPE